MKYSVRSNTLFSYLSLLVVYWYTFAWMGGHSKLAAVSEVSSSDHIICIWFILFWLCFNLSSFFTRQHVLLHARCCNVIVAEHSQACVLIIDGVGKDCMPEPLSVAKAFEMHTHERGRCTIWDGKYSRRKSIPAAVDPPIMRWWCSREHWFLDFDTNLRLWVLCGVVRVTYMGILAALIRWMSLSFSVPSKKKQAQIVNTPEYSSVRCVLDF